MGKSGSMRCKLRDNFLAEGSPSCVTLTTTRSSPGSQEYASTDRDGSDLLGDRKGQRFAVAAAVATEVSGEVGRSVHDNLGGTRR
jgi:hypothetical protein